MLAGPIQTWITRRIAVRQRLERMCTSSLLFLMVTTTKHSLEEAARFSGLHKSHFSKVLKYHSNVAIYTLENGARGEALAIVTGKDVEARLATADNAKSVLVLPAGSEIKILSERGDWVYAALPNDQRGWIPAASAQRVRM